MLLLYLHYAAATIHLISAALSWVVHVDVKGSITIPKHEYTSGPVDKTTTYETWIDTNPMVWISVNEFLTFFSHVIAILYLMKHENDKKFEAPRRAIEYSLTAGLLQCALLLGAGAVPLQVLIFVVITNVAMQLIGYVIDNGTSQKTMLMIIGFLLLASQIQCVLFNALRIEGISIDSFIVMGVFYGLFYVAFGVLKIYSPRDEDEIYVLMSVTSKIVLSWILIGNIFEGFKELNEKTEPDYTNFDWRALQGGIIGIGLLGLAVGILLIINRSNSPLRSSGMTEVVVTGKFKDLRY